MTSIQRIAKQWDTQALQWQRKMLKLRSMLQIHKWCKFDISSSFGFIHVFSLSGRVFIVCIRLQSWSQNTSTFVKWFYRFPIWKSHIQNKDTPAHWIFFNEYPLAHAVKERVCVCDWIGKMCIMIHSISCVKQAFYNFTIEQNRINVLLIISNRLL